MKASAYSSLVVVDVAIVERDCATFDAEATSALPKEGQAWHIREKRAPQRGNGVDRQDLSAAGQANTQD